MLAAEFLSAISADEPAGQSAALVSTAVSEGEPAPDLVAFAKDLTAAGVQFFGAAWCPACKAQKELFEDGKDNLPFIEVTNPDRSLNATGIAENISAFPTWKFTDGTVVTGVQTLAQLSSLSGVDIPQSEQPTFKAIGNQTVRIGSPLHIPIDAYDPDGGPLTVTVSVDNPALIEATVISGNRSMQIDVAGWGKMVFELFEQRAPGPTERIVELADSGFYEGIIFHRVADDFVLQAGDPGGTGSGGSTLGDIDDQFHPDLQHNRSGILSYAKTSDDTNDSQFFITEPATRHLDFNHSIFGQLVEGDDVREAISETEVIAPNANPPNHRPVRDVVINSVDIFTDIENSVVMLKALGNTTGTTNVTFTVTDQDGNTHSEIVQVSVVPDNANSQPYLTEIDVPTEMFVGQTIEIQLDSMDVEGDDVRYQAGFAGEIVTESIEQETGVLSITAPAETGSVLFIAVVEAPPGNGPNYDRQVFSIDIVEPPPYHDVANPADVDGVDGLTARDALLIINAMFANGGEIDLSGGEVEGLDPTFSYNVSGDMKISALDALRVINALAAGESQQGASGADLETTQTDAAFANYNLLVPMFSDQDNDKRDDLISILAQYQLGLQTLA